MYYNLIYSVNYMILTRYNIFCISRLQIFIVTLVFCLVVTPLYAQPLSSKTLNCNIEKFQQYRTVDRERAYDYASMVLADVDSTAVSEDIAMVCDFMSEYSESNLHRYNDALQYRQRAYGIYEKLENRACLARTNALLARIYLRNNDYHNAFSSGIKALDEGRIIGDSTTVREAYLALEQVDYFYHHDLERAMDYNMRVSSHYSDRAQAHQAVRALNNRFHYELSPDDVNEVIAQCETICTEFGFNDLLVNVYLNAAMQEFMFDENVEFTIADIFDLAKSYHIDLMWFIREKLEYNKKRAYLHGKAY